MTVIDYRARQLAIPRMHRDIPRENRIKVIELILRRQFGAAYDLAQDLEEARLTRLGRGSDPKIVGLIAGSQLGAKSFEYLAA